MLQIFTKESEVNLAPGLIDRDSILRKIRITKLETGITAYKMKRNEVNICLRKTKSKY